MSEVLATSEDGRYRVILEQDVDAQAPEDDAQGYVFALDYGRMGNRSIECLAAPVGDPWADDMAAALLSATSRWDLESDETRRYLAIFWDVVSMATYHRRAGGVFVMLVTSAMCDEWGIPAGAPYRLETADLRDWEAWDEGDVYGYVIEERTTWHADGREGREEWEETDESCWGFYGYSYAREEALEAFAGAGARS